MRRLCVAGIVAAAALCAVPAAHAYTIGPSTLFPASDRLLCNASPCVYTNHTAPTGVRLSTPSSGVMTRFRIVGSGPFTLRVLRSSGATTYRLAGTGPTLNGSGTNNEDVFATRMPIGMLERVGLQIAAGSEPGSTSSAGFAVAVAGPAPGNGPNNVTFSTFGGESYLNYNYDVEPDADGDSFGDESQDRCVGTEGTDRGCRPGVLNPPPQQVTRVVQVTRPAGGTARLTAAGVKLAKNRKTVAVPVSCPAGNATRCAGTVTVQTAGKVAVAAQRKRKKRRRAVVKLGTARFSLVPGVSRTVGVKVSRKARRALRGRKKLKLRIVVTESRAVTRDVG